MYRAQVVPLPRIVTLLASAALAAGCGSSSAETGASADTVGPERQPSAPAAEPAATLARRYAEAVIAAAMASAELPVYGDHPTERLAAARVMVAAARTANELAREQGIAEPDELEGPVTLAAEALTAHLEHPSVVNEWLYERQALVMELVQAMTLGVAVLESRTARFFEGLDAPDAACMEARLRVFFSMAGAWRQVRLDVAATAEHAAWEAMTRSAADLDADPRGLPLPDAGPKDLDRMMHQSLAGWLRGMGERCATR